MSCSIIEEPREELNPSPVYCHYHINNQHVSQNYNKPDCPLKVFTCVTLILTETKKLDSDIILTLETW